MADTPATPAFELRQGDRVAFVGDTLIERASVDELLETALTIAWPERHVVFRNLGWSGDDVTGEARAGFGTPEDGFKQLEQQVTDFRPTVILVAYGANASFKGREKLPEFQAGFRRLLDMLGRTKARVVLLSPIRHEKHGPPLPDPAVHNANRQLYAETVGEIARERGARFVDVFKYLEPQSEERLTDNGIHLNTAGYARLAEILREQLGITAGTFSAELKTGSTEADVRGAAQAKLMLTGTGGTFSIRRTALPIAPIDQDHWTISGLDAGEYALKAGGRELATHPAAAWSRGVTLSVGPDYDQSAQLRATIRAKNQLFFHRWRPQNETYLFGFRKHEQGQNAKEIPMFDPLIEAKEKEIARLRVPGGPRVRACAKVSGSWRARPSSLVPLSSRWVDERRSLRAEYGIESRSRRISVHPSGSCAGLFVNTARADLRGLNPTERE